MTINRVSSRWPARRFPRALRAAGLFLLGVALTWSHWYAHAYGRSVERAAILRQIGPLITGACIRAPDFTPKEPDT